MAPDGPPNPNPWPAILRENALLNLHQENLELRRDLARLRKYPEQRSLDQLLEEANRLIERLKKEQTDE